MAQNYFSEYATTLLERGYHPVPIQPGTKRVIENDWANRFCLVPPSSDQVAGWRREKGAWGIGLACGRYVGLDIDVLDEKIAQEIETLAVSTFGKPLKRIGQYPKRLLVYRAEAAFSKIPIQKFRLPDDPPDSKGHGVEVLAKGSQFVAYAIHPETGNSYSWVGGEPISSRVDDLPTVDAAQARWFVGEAEQILRAHGAVPATKEVSRLEITERKPKAPEALGGDLAELEKALTHLSADCSRGYWIKIGQALKNATGDAGRDVFVRWSTVPERYAANADQAASTYDSFRVDTDRDPRDRAGAATIFAEAAKSGYERTDLAPRASAQEDFGSFAKIDPVDLFASDSLAGKPDLPTGLLPSVIEDFARDVAERQGVEAGMPAAACIAALAGALHDGFRIQPRQFDTAWTESARLWIQVVADPGIGKTPAIEPGLKPLKEIEGRWLKEDGRRRHAYEAELDAHKKRMKRGTDKAAELPAGSDTSKLWLEALPPEEPEFRRIFVDDLTTEALGSILRCNPRGVMLMVDELSGWYGSFDAYRGGSTGKDRPSWLQAFQGGPRTIDRAGRGHVGVENWSASIVGGIQPDRMRQLAARGGLADDGLLQRFLTIWGRRTGDSKDRAPDDLAGRHWRSLIENMAEARPVDFSTTLVRLTPDASAVFQSVLDWSRDLCLLPGTSPAFRGHLNKWGALYARLLLAVHAAETFDLLGALGDKVGLETAERTKKLFFRYFLPHSAALYREILGASGTSKHSEWIAGHILARELSTVTLYEITRAYRDVRDDPEAARRAVMPLESAGWVVPVERGGGKPVKQWTVNPKVHRLYGERAKAERARRDAEILKIQGIAARVSRLAVD